MSGLYLPNATLPKYGHKIEIIFDGSVAYVDYVNPYRELPPAIEVPDHGDLIDRSELDPYYIGAQRGEIAEEWAVLRRSDVDYAPIVIPADKEDREFK